MDERRLGRVTQRQRGLFTRDDARRCGFSGYQVTRRLASGEWLVVIGSTLTRAGTEVTQKLRDRAALLALRGSMLAGPSAARVWGMPVTDDRTVLAVPAYSRRTLPGAVVLKLDIDEADIGWVAGCRTTWRQRTVFDCLRLIPKEQAIVLLDRALQQRWATLDGLRELTHANVGRRGIRDVRALLRLAAGGERSAAERRLTALLLEAGITGWRANAEIRDIRGKIGCGDVVFAAEKVVVELDGLAFHITPDRFQHDRTRQNRLVAAGWTVLRFTWLDLIERHEYVLVTIRSALARNGTRAAQAA